MPIVEVEFVGEQSPNLAAQALADTLGTAFGSESGQTWVRFRHLPRDSYAENGAPIEEDQLPVFVQILHARPPAGAALATELAAVTQAVAKFTGRGTAQVHVEYAPAGAGRQAFGGQLVK